MLHGWTTITIEWALVLLSLVFVGLRIYVRITSPGSCHTLSDWIVICAWLSMVSMMACDTVLYKLHVMEHGHTYGKDLLTWNQKASDTRKMLKIIWASVLPYTCIIYLVKAAIVAWYYTITPPTLPRCRIALHMITICCVSGFCMAVGFNGLYCWPISRNWSLDPDQLCVASAQLPTFFITFACHLVTDLMIFLYPFPLLKSVHRVHRKQRTWGIIFLFTLGFIAIASTLARVTAISLSTTAPVIAVWTAVECTTNILIACAPTLRVLVQSQKSPRRIHNRKPPPPNKFPTDDTYISNHSTSRTVLHSEIWDGTDSTAPDWIRLDPRSTATDGSGAMYSMDSMEKDRISVVSSGGIGPGNGGGYVYNPPRSHPSLFLQPGRGIVSQVPNLPTSPEETPPWMNLPEMEFLSERDEDRITYSGESSKKPTVRWDLGAAQLCGNGNLVVSDSSNPNAAGPNTSSESVDRIATPIAKRWSNGSFGDRQHRSS